MSKLMLMFLETSRSLFNQPLSNGSLPDRVEAVKFLKRYCDVVISDTNAAISLGFVAAQDSFRKFGNGFTFPLAL